MFVKLYKNILQMIGRLKLSIVLSIKSGINGHIITKSH